MNNKKYIYTIIAGLLLVGAATPALAIESSGYRYQTGSETGEKLQRNFCSSLTSFSALKDTRMAEWDKNLSSKRMERNSNIERRRTEREQKLDEVRLQADEKRALGYQKISAKAVTDEQKAAVQRFQTAVESAVSERRTAISNAIEAYRDGLDLAISERKEALDGALNGFKLEVKNHEQNAASQCSSGKDALAVRTQFQSAVATARQAYKEKRSEALKVSETVKALNDVRKEAFEKAKNDFMNALEEAKNELKSAFPLKGQTATGTVAE